MVVATLGTRASPYAFTPGAVVNAQPNSVAPQPVAALSDSGRGVVAYTPSPGALDAVLFSRGAASAPIVLSSPTLGPVAAGGGLRAGADVSGDLAVGFVAGAPTALSVLVEPIVVTLGAPRATGTQRWTTRRRPVLRWLPSAPSWTPPTYAVYIDSRRVATTRGTSYAVPNDLRDGRHTWRVVAVDSLGGRAPSSTHPLLVDAAPPLVRLRIGGARTAGAAVRFTVEANAPSGLRRVALDFGDGHAAVAPSASHVYASAGRYTVVVTVTDGAHVRAMLRVQMTIA